MMLSDIEIAQQAKMLPIAKVAENLGINADDLEFYGKYKAKLSDELIEKCKNRKDGKLILVTAINPTPAGEGKQILLFPSKMFETSAVPSPFTAASFSLAACRPPQAVLCH